MEIVGYLMDGMIEDWDIFEKILNYTYTKCIKSESEFHPVLMSGAPVCYILFIFKFHIVSKNAFFVVEYQSKAGKVDRNHV